MEERAQARASLRASSGATMFFLAMTGSLRRRGCAGGCRACGRFDEGEVFGAYGGPAGVYVQKADVDAVHNGAEPAEVVFSAVHGMLLEIRPQRETGGRESPLHAMPAAVEGCDGRPGGNAGLHPSMYGEATARGSTRSPCR